MFRTSLRACLAIALLGGCYRSHGGGDRDAAVMVHDAGRPMPDAGRPRPDAGRPRRDAGRAMPDAGHDTGMPDAGDALSERYCDCMTRYCDIGADYGACMMNARALPRRGSPTMEGDFIECRIHWCEVHITSFDNLHCAHARGASVCVP